MSKPKNWPPTHAYLTAPLHSKSLTNHHLQALRSPLDSANVPLPRIGPNETQTPSPNVKIRKISDESHPAHAQHGLFANRAFRPGDFILAYLGEVHPGRNSKPDSDYDLWIDRGADVSVDAARAGNEARFVNDYRGVRDRPNAVFGNVFCERWGEVCVGVWALKNKKGGGIKRGEEIVVSYGKGFWGERRDDEDEAS